MVYSVKEIFLTVQGEGAQSGSAAVFCRFSGCNLWSGRELDRLYSACSFCDTDFVGTDGVCGGKYLGSQELAAQILSQWGRGTLNRLVVLTGGEPLLQVDSDLIEALHHSGFRIAVETNGSIPVISGIDWICVSPKAKAPWVQKTGQELKLVWPQDGFDLEQIFSLSEGFEHRFLQPLDGPNLSENMRLCVKECLRNPAWRLSVQMHKWLGIP